MLFFLIVLLTLQQTSFTRSERVARSDTAWHSQYHNLNEINQKLKEINSTFDNAILFSIGKSYYNRDTMAIKITGAKKENKPVFAMQCLIHGREWVTGSVCMYFADQLTKNYGVDNKITAMLDKVDFVIIPVANPDGYDYTWHSGGTNDYSRLWLKSRRYLGYGCRGVDLNRNFAFAFGYNKDPYTNGYQCHETYMGPWAHSEAETRNIAGFLSSIRGNLKGFIDFQAVGRSWHYPWKYTSDDSPDKAEQERVARAATSAIRHDSGYGTSYLPLAAGAGLQIGGTSMDYVYGSLGVKYSYTVKLQTKHAGYDGYKLRPSLILTTAKEAIIGVRALVEAMNV
ncbi:hypothetical protein ACROYT_G033087 [Oculina patagonica]